MRTRIYATIAQAVAATQQSAVAPLTWNPVDHLLSRFTFGPTQSARALVRKQGFDGWYRTMITYARQYPGYSGHRGVAAQGPLLSMQPYELRQWLKANNREYGLDALQQLVRVTLGLQSWSHSQLGEVLVDFFSNHLNVPARSDMWVTRHRYDQDVVRKNVTGSFTNMLLASSKSPAMLTYLNLKDSAKAAINENYGRELLELHTLGSHYSENDVKNTARMLTGRTVTSKFEYTFVPANHPTGRITVLGFTHQNIDAGAGEKAGDDLIRYLASHPSTARTLARKLCIRFVSDEPTDALIDAVAQAYLENRTQILPMVSVILRSAEFWSSRGRKVRRPTENLVATVRVLGLGVTDWSDALGTLQWVSQGMGNGPLGWVAPNGYPDVATAWRSASILLKTWSQHISLVGGWWGGFTKPAIEDFYSEARTSGEAVAMLSYRLTGTSWSSAHLSLLQQFLNEPASTALSKSALKNMAYPLAAVILDGPHHALR